jgi:hypothetical protein
MVKCKWWWSLLKTIEDCIDFRIASDNDDEHSWKERSPNDFAGFEIVCENNERQHKNNSFKLIPCVWNCEKSQ